MPQRRPKKLNRIRKNTFTRMVNEGRRILDKYEPQISLKMVSGIRQGRSIVTFENS